MREADALTLPVFFKHPVGLTVGEIATLTGAKLRTGARLDDLITNVAPLNRAGSSDLAFLDTAKYADVLTSTRAGACLMTERFENQAPSGMNVLRAKEPYRAFVIVARRLFEDSLRPSSLFEAEGVPSTAALHPSAQVAIGVTIDPGAVIGPRALIGTGTVIGANAVIGADVRIGRDCSIGPGASIIHAIVGDSVIFHPGCRIGQDGFRYLPGANGHTKVPQPGASSLATMWRSAPERPSTVAVCATPSSAKAPRSTTSSRSPTTSLLVVIALSPASAGSPAA